MRKMAIRSWTVLIFPKKNCDGGVWGVADEVFFNEALAVMDDAHAKGERTCQMIMTTSNHQPYTYPDGRIDIPSQGEEPWINLPIFRIFSHLPQEFLG